LKGPSEQFTLKRTQLFCSNRVYWVSLAPAMMSLRSTKPPSDTSAAFPSIPVSTAMCTRGSASGRRMDLARRRIPAKLLRAVY